MRRKGRRLILLLLVAGTIYVVLGWLVWRLQLHWTVHIAGADYGFRQIKDITILILAGEEARIPVFLTPTSRFLLL